jgi:hypothetical protein
MKILIKSNGYQFGMVLEEISTIEQLKKSFFSLYKNRKCVFCNLNNETFSHVWKCNARIEEIEQLKHDHFEILLNEINSQLKEKNIFLSNIENIFYIPDYVKGIMCICLRFFPSPFYPFLFPLPSYISFILFKFY